MAIRSVPGVIVNLATHRFLTMMTMFWSSSQSKVLLEILIYGFLPAKSLERHEPTILSQLNNNEWQCIMIHKDVEDNMHVRDCARGRQTWGHHGHKFIFCNQMTPSLDFWWLCEFFHEGNDPQKQHFTHLKNLWQLQGLSKTTDLKIQRNPLTTIHK